ncbi:FlgB family protein [Oceanicola sp. D3]|uniref:FlgB family protein n=1 Tax=Oceanicola sp. D3 TaxID=2587163 RepID=UPI001AEFBBF7|nr:FlgB family protein [Oceanicola sp. D3]
MASVMGFSTFRAASRAPETLSKGITVKPRLKPVGETPMFDQLEILNMARGLATHSATRQQVVAQNLAQADTAGYKARDIASFGAVYQNGPGLELRQTRSGHVAGEMPPEALRPFIERGIDGDPNGNTVSIESQMVKSAEVQTRHEMALSIYRTTLGLMRATLGRG